MGDRRWSDTDRELVARTWYEAETPDRRLPAAWTDTGRSYREHADAVLDALTAGGWRPPPPEPDGIQWRTGTSVGRTIYNPYGDLAGLMHTEAQARAVVAALNAARIRTTLTGEDHPQ